MDIIRANDEYGDYYLIPVWEKEEIIFYTMIDPENYHWLNQFRWIADNGGYVVSSSGLVNGTARMHRWILMNEDEDITDLHVDHINRKVFDNRKRNLRPATPGQNARNRGFYKDARVEYKGVTTNFSGNYRVGIGFNNKYYHLGTYSDPVRAAETYDIAALRLDPEHYSLNFPDKDYSGTTLEKHQSLYCRRQTSEYRSVCYVDAGWRAQVTHDGKRYSSRSYLTQDDAAKVADILRIELKGYEALANLNYPPEEYEGFLDGNYTGISSDEFHRRYSLDRAPTNKYRGIREISSKGWKAIVFKDKKTYLSEIYANIEDAAREADYMRIKLHGKKALRSLNFPIEEYLHLFPEVS